MSAVTLADAVEDFPNTDMIRQQYAEGKGQHLDQLETCHSLSDRCEPEDQPTHRVKLGCTRSATPKGYRPWVRKKEREVASQPGQSPQRGADAVCILWSSGCCNLRRHQIRQRKLDLAARIEDLLIS